MKYSRADDSGLSAKVGRRRIDTLSSFCLLKFALNAKACPVVDRRSIYGVGSPRVLDAIFYLYFT